MARMSQDKIREQLREQLWPNSEGRIWQGPKETGYWCAPRTLPLLLHLANDKRIVGKVDCSFVYIEILSRDFGQGIVEIKDPDEHAYCSGYTGNRALRSWRERMIALSNAGFIEVKPKGNRSLGYVLVIHPRLVVEALRAQKKVDDTWWNLMQDQLRKAGAPGLEDPTSELRVIQGGLQEDSPVRPSRRGRRSSH